VSEELIPVDPIDIALARVFGTDHGDSDRHEWDEDACGTRQCTVCGRSGGSWGSGEVPARCCQAYTENLARLVSDLGGLVQHGRVIRFELSGLRDGLHDAEVETAAGRWRSSSADPARALAGAAEKALA
jgi:hypothetical protein